MEAKITIAYYDFINTCRFLVRMINMHRRSRSQWIFKKLRLLE